MFVRLFRLFRLTTTISFITRVAPHCVNRLANYARGTHEIYMAWSQAQGMRRWSASKSEKPNDSSFAAKRRDCAAPLSSSESSSSAIAAQ